MTHRFKANDKVRDQETLFATSSLRKAMETMEFQFFAKGAVTWDDVVTARDEYLEAWEERRNFVLGDKYGISRADLEKAMVESEGANQG